VSTLESHGLVFSGKDETQQRMEILELDAERWAHPYFVGVQFHPEYLSRPQRPAPVFLGLMNAIQEARGQRLEAEKVSAQ
jgi:CTP synthase